jgi:hypothetical protein
MSKKIPEKNRSPYGWWVATIIERFVYDDEDERNPKRCSTAWVNTVMLKARDRHHAYRKAISYAEIGKGDEAHGIDEKTGRGFRIVTQGLQSLLPVYDEIDEDGFEVLWQEYENVSVDRIESWLKEKHELEVFDDTVG